MKIILPLLAACAALAAAEASQAADSCFRLSQTQGHTVVDPKTLYLGTTDHSIYRLTMSGACLAAKTSSDPIITRPFAGNDIICKPIDLDLKVGGPGGISPCIISGIQKLSPAEAAAVPKKLRP